MKRLEGRTAVITGGGSGVGAAMARCFADCGMRVLVADIAGDHAERMAAELRDSGAEAAACRVDIGAAESLAELARSAGAFGGCDLLCANVGVQRIGHTNDLRPEDWQWLIGVNVLGTVATVEALLPVMRASEGEGHMVFTASTSALFAAPRLAAYTASKYAVTGYAETLREELAPEGIGVTILFPSGMATTHLESSNRARPVALGSSPDLLPEDIEAVSGAMSPRREDIVDPAHAIRHLPAAVRENRPYLVTHGANNAAIEARFAALREALDRADA